MEIKDIFPLIASFLSGMLGILGGLWLATYKMKIDRHLDLMRKRLVALQNFLLLIDYLLILNKNTENVQNNNYINIKQHIVKENIANSIFVPKKLRKYWKKIWPLIIKMNNNDSLKQDCINIDLNNIRKLIYKEIDLYFEQSDILEKSSILYIIKKITLC